MCDGFTGNIVLKLTEGIFSNIHNWTKKDRKENKLSIESTISNFDYEEHGGTPLLGIKGIVIKSHGSSSKKSIINSLKTAVTLHEKKLIDNIENGILNKTSYEIQ